MHAIPPPDRVPGTLWTWLVARKGQHIRTSASVSCNCAARMWAPVTQQRTEIYVFMRPFQKWL
jgi:hypothetical protein